MTPRILNAMGKQAAKRWFLGIDGGATKTIALFANASGVDSFGLELGPANQRMMTNAELERLFRQIAAGRPRPAGLGICLAGGWEERDWRRIRSAAAVVWPGVPCHAGNDLEAALMAADSDDAEEAEARVLVLSGTGSCCYGRDLQGRTAKVGGWGHVLGDQGSGFDIGLQALRRVAAEADQTGRWPALGARFLRALQLNTPNDLIDWAQSASKAAVAGLAVEVFEAWKLRDTLAAGILSEVAERLASDAALCAAKVAPRGNPVRFVFAGGVLLKQPRFAQAVARHLRGRWPGARITHLARESVWGAVRLGMLAAGRRLPSAEMRSTPTPRKALGAEEPLPVSTRLSPTEARNPVSARLDTLPVGRAITLMLSEDAKLPGCLLEHRDTIARIIQLLARSMKSGGRLFYVGAGTSGRLGVIDASECPPTFQTSPDQVQAIIAGGREALWASIEGAEDDTKAGRDAVAFRNVARRDVVIGIAASGTTPFVWGALKEAKRRRAVTVMVCFNPFLRIPPQLKPNILLAVNLGPELLTGSTRLKAGTATKLLLNLFTTLTMVRLGKVVGNLMVDLNPANTKLRGRAVRIVRELSGADAAAAEEALAKTGWNVREALAWLHRREPMLNQKNVGHQESA